MKLARRNLFLGVCGVLLGRAVGPERAAHAIAAVEDILDRDIRELIHEGVDFTIHVAGRTISTWQSGRPWWG